MKIVGVLKNGEIVYDRYRSHISDKDGLPIEEALSQITPPDNLSFYEAEVKMPSHEGFSNIVKTSDSDQIFYAKRPNRDTFSRFVKNRSRERSDTLVVVIKKRENSDGYILITSFWGKISPPEPSKETSSDKVIQFWRNHAFVDGTVSYLTGTVQNNPPEEWRFIDHGEPDTATATDTYVPKSVLTELGKFIDPEINSKIVNEYQFIQKQLLNDITADNSAFILDEADEQLLNEVKQCFAKPDHNEKITVKWSNQSMEGYSVLYSHDYENRHLVDIYCNPPVIAPKKQMLIMIRDLNSINPVIVGEMASCGLICLAKFVNKIKDREGGYNDA